MELILGVRIISGDATKQKETKGDTGQLEGEATPFTQWKVALASCFPFIRGQMSCQGLERATLRIDLSNIWMVTLLASRVQPRLRHLGVSSRALEQPFALGK